MRILNRTRTQAVACQPVAMKYLSLLVVAITALAVAESAHGSDVVSIIYKQFHVDSLIFSRYAVTTVTSVVRNDDPEESKELEFRVQLPENAFISNFSMLVNGRTFYGVAKEKAEAAEEFENRIDAGENAGLVESRGAEVFSVRINTAADSEATFTLQYEELMVRRRSKYQQVLNLNPGSLVDDVSVQVRVVDPQGVIETAAPDYVTKNRISRNEVVFTYSPTTQQQKEDSDQFGLGRDLTIEFDVRPSSDDAGSFVVDVNCYFAQFFAPAGVSAVPVDLVFVIDVSGSMSGTKISQTRQALETIINELRSTDRFTMITFSTTVTRWRPRLVSAGEYRETAVEFVRGLEADGSTNFNAAVLDGADVLKTYGSSEYVPLLVVLTDGEPTVGVTNENEIVENVHTALSGTVISLNCLGFGNSLNFQLLERLALQNNGIVRRIYEAVDAPEQLEGFFEEISSPVLRNVVVSYDSASVDSLSTTEFPLLFDGGEIVVAGKCDESSPEINVEITGTGGDGLVSYQTDFSTTPTDTIAGFSPSTERLLAYLLIQQLLETKFTLSDEELIEVNLRQALRLSLKYNFVTELTSLIVVEESDDGSGSSSESIIGGDGQGDDGEYEYDVAFATAVDYDYSNPHFAPSGGSPPAHAVPAIAAIIMLIMTVHALM